MKIKFPSMTLEYLSLSAMLALGGIYAGSWLSTALLARIHQVCQLMVLR